MGGGGSGVKCRSKLKDRFPEFTRNLEDKLHHLDTSLRWYTNRNSELEKWIYFFFLTNKIRTAYTPDVSIISKPRPQPDPTLLTTIQPGLHESRLHLSNFAASLRFTLHARDFRLDPAGREADVTLRRDRQRSVEVGEPFLSTYFPTISFTWLLTRAR